MISSLLINSDLYELSSACGEGFRDTFNRDLIVILPKFFKPEAFAILTAEVQRMGQRKRRRDLLMPDSGNTPRKMSILSGTDILQMSSIIPMLYLDEEFRDFLSSIAGETVYPVPDSVENYVCNFLHLDGDTHGGHIDTYPFAFNIMIEAPPRDMGGTLEIVKGSSVLQDLDYETKVTSVYIPPGDCYLLRTDKAVHRVSPLINSWRRTVINFAYTNAASLNVWSYSSGILYGDQNEN